MMTKFSKPLPIIALFFATITLASLTQFQWINLMYIILIVWSVFALFSYSKAHAQIGEMIGGRVVAAVDTPRPSSSMLASLRSRGVLANQIKHIRLMTYDLTEANNYLAGTRFRGAVAANSSLTVTIIGSGAVPPQPVENVTFKQCTMELTEHLNLIETNDGRQFVWYEPEHTVSNGIHSLPHGAYLVEVSDAASWRAAEERYENCVAA